MELFATTIPGRHRSLHGAHHEDRVAEGIDYVECPCTPWFVLRRASNLVSIAPFIVVRIGAVHLQRDAGVSAMTGHRGIKREGDGPAIDAQKPGPAILRCFKTNLEPQPIDVKLLCSAEVICWQDWYGSFHLVAPIAKWEMVDVGGLAAKSRRDSFKRMLGSAHP
jgi:hypothetical protein